MSADKETLIESCRIIVRDNGGCGGVGVCSECIAYQTNWAENSIYFDCDLSESCHESELLGAAKRFLAEHDTSTEAPYGYCNGEIIYGRSNHMSCPYRKGDKVLYWGGVIGAQDVSDAKQAVFEGVTDGHYKYGLTNVDPYDSNIVCYVEYCVLDTRPNAIDHEAAKITPYGVDIGNLAGSEQHEIRIAYPQSAISRAKLEELNSDLMNGFSIQMTGWVDYSKREENEDGEIQIKSDIKKLDIGALYDGD